MKRPHPSLVTLVVGVALGWGAAQLVGSPRRGALETREAAEAEAAAGSAAVTCPVTLADAQLAVLRADLARLATASAPGGPVTAPPLEATVDNAAAAGSESSESSGALDSSGAAGLGADHASELAPSAASVTANDAISRHLEVAFARGTWTLDDRQELRRHLVALTQRQTQDLMSTLVLALNEGRLRQDHPGPLL